MLHVHLGSWCPVSSRPSQGCACWWPTGGTWVSSQANQPNYAAAKHCELLDDIYCMYYIYIIYIRIYIYIRILHYITVYRYTTVCVLLWLRRLLLLQITIKIYILRITNYHHRYHPCYYHPSWQICSRLESLPYWGHDMILTSAMPGEKHRAWTLPGEHWYRGKGLGPATGAILWAKVVKVFQHWDSQERADVFQHNWSQATVESSQHAIYIFILCQTSRQSSQSLLCQCLPFLFAQTSVSGAVSKAAIMALSCLIGQRAIDDHNLLHKPTGTTISQSHTPCPLWPANCGCGVDLELRELVICHGWNVKQAEYHCSYFIPWLVQRLQQI